MKNSHKLRRAYIRGMGLAIIVSAFFLPSYMKPENTGNNIFYITLNGTFVGTSATDDAEGLLRQARLSVAGESSESVMLKAELSVEGDEVYFGKVDSEEVLIANMAEVMRADEVETLTRSYTVKINDFTVNLASSQEVLELLGAVFDKYDTTGNYGVRLVLDPFRELNVLTTQVVNREEERKKEENARNYRRTAGVDASMPGTDGVVIEAEERDFSDYELGLISMEYGDVVEVVEAYLPPESITPLGSAIE